jgi:hypothetical protein
MPPRSPKLYRLHRWEVSKVWPTVKPWIEEALDRSNSDFSIEYFRQKIDCGDTLLWIIVDGRILAAGTTECLHLQNGRKLCLVSTLAGANMAVWDGLWEQVEDYARREGCDGIQIVGRVGWVRHMKARGFKQPWVMLEKKL